MSEKRNQMTIESHNKPYLWALLATRKLLYGSTIKTRGTIVMGSTGYIGPFHLASKSVFFRHAEKILFNNFYLIEFFRKKVRRHMKWSNFVRFFWEQTFILCK